MKNFKRLTSIIIAASVICASPVFAATNEQIQSAWSLYSMGLFSGMGVNSDGTPVFDLDSSITRAQTITLILNLTGKASEAENGNWKTPFTDLPEWAEKYIGYAYTMGYAQGVSSDKFSPDSEVDANQFCAFILRALGYSEENGDFEYENALETAYKKGIANESYDGFTRGDAVEIAYNALSININNSSLTLYDTLLNSGVVTSESASLDLTSSSVTATTEMSAEEIYEKCSPAVFYIEVYDANGKSLQSGSGFFINSDGTAVTNYHVLEGGSSAKITLSDSGKVYNVEGVYDYDKNRDIALIKVEGSGFSYLETANSDEVKGGATVYAIGSPLGLSNTISQGLISNTNRVIDGKTYLQTTAAISSGSSGGALINTSGQVIGITSGEVAQSTSSGTVTGQNLNLAIPINSISSLSKDSVTSLSDVYKKEILGSSVIEVSDDNITLNRGDTAVVTVKCQSDVTAGLTGKLSNTGIVSAKFAKTGDGATLVITGLNKGTSEIILKMVSSTGSILAEKTINITVK